MSYLLEDNDDHFRLLIDNNVVNMPKMGLSQAQLSNIAALPKMPGGSVTTLADAGRSDTKQYYNVPSSAPPTAGAQIAAGASRVAGMMMRAGDADAGDPGPAGGDPSAGGSPDVGLPSAAAEGPPITTQPPSAADDPMANLAALQPGTADMSVPSGASAADDPMANLGALQPRDAEMSVPPQPSVAEGGIAEDIGGMLALGMPVTERMQAAAMGGPAVGVKTKDPVVVDIGVGGPPRVSDEYGKLREGGGAPENLASQYNPAANYLSDTERKELFEMRKAYQAGEVARQGEVRGKIQEIEKMQDSIKDTKFSPWRDKTTGEKVGISLFFALAAFGQGIAGRDPTAIMGMMMKAMNNDVSRQKAELAAKRGVIQGKINSLGMLRDTLDDERSADLALRNMQIQDVRLRLQDAAQRSGDQAKKIQLMQTDKSFAEQQRMNNVSIVNMEQNAGFQRDRLRIARKQVRIQERQNQFMRTKEYSKLAQENKGRELSDKQIQRLSDFTSAARNIDELEKKFNKVGGEVYAGSGFIPGSEASEYTDRRLVEVTNYTKAVTGAQFSVKEVERYEEQFPNSTTTKWRAKEQFDALRRNVTQKYHTETENLRRNGFYVPDMLSPGTPTQLEGPGQIW